MFFYIFFYLFIIECLSQNPSLTAYPTIIKKSGDSVELSWSIQSPQKSDVIQFAVGNDVVVGEYHLKEVLNFGTLRVVLPNLREKITFYYSQMIGGVYTPVATAEARFQNPFEVTQLHLSLTHEPTEMRVMFTSADETIPFVEVQKIDINGNPLSTLKKFTGTFHTYKMNQMCNYPANNTIGFMNPGFMHDVLMTGLNTSTLYQYRVGTQNQVATSFKRFVSAPRAGPSDTVQFQVFGDMGVDTAFAHPEFWYKLGVEEQQGAPGTLVLMERYVAEGVPVQPWRRGERPHVPLPSYNATLAALHRRVARRWGAPSAPGQVVPRLIIDVGDISYARGLGVLWEYFMHAIQPSAQSAPFQVAVGNHEYDHPAQKFHPPGSDYGDDSLGECGVPYSARFHMPAPIKGQKQPVTSRNYWYSYEFGPVHFTTISTEQDFLVGSEQYRWFVDDVSRVDRRRTPWLLVLAHRPFYTSEGNWRKPYGLTVLLRDTFEPLFQKYKVDVTVYGHVHAYERTCGIQSNGTCAPRDEDGTVHICAGSAGNSYQGSWDSDAAAAHRIPPPWTVFRTHNHGITEFKVSAKKLEMIMLGSIRGEVHDKLVLEK